MRSVVACEPVAVGAGSAAGLGERVRLDRGAGEVGAGSARRRGRDVAVDRKNPASASLNRLGLRDITSWPQSGATNSRPSGELAAEPPGVVDRHERVTVAADDEARRVDPAQVARASAAAGPRCRRRSPAGAAATRPRPGPRRGAGRARRPRRGSSRSARSGSISRRATEARGSRWVVIPTTVIVRSRSGLPTRVLERVIAPIEKPIDMERLEPELVDERGEVVDEPVVAESVRHVPAGPPVAAGVGHVAAGSPREERDLGGEVLAAERGRAVEQDERRTGAVNVVGDVEPVRPDRRHALGPPSRSSASLGAVIVRERSATAASPPDRSPGLDDLRTMTGLLSAAWARPARALVTATPGDLEWWTAFGGPGFDWSERIRIWALEGDPVAWGWFKPPAEVDWFVSGDVAADDEDRIRIEILGWHRLLALRGVRDRPIAEQTEVEEPPLEAWAADGRSEAAFLTARGWSDAT